MSSSKFTLIGFYGYMRNNNKDLFDKLVLPTGIDKQTVIDNILLEGGEFEVYYSDPNFLREAIGVWSIKWERTFTKWLNALNINYDPLNNYDRTEEWYEEGTGSSSANDTSSGNVNSNSSTNISAFNSDDMRPDTTGTDSTSNYNNSHTDADSSTTNKRTGRAFGNIGVTTSQQMLESELSIAEWNIYEHITDVFLKEFVIPLF